MSPTEFAKYLACNCCQGTPLPIEYYQRSPILRWRKPTGEIRRITWGSKVPKEERLCRGCGGPIGKGRSAWCCRACYHRFDPGMVKQAVIGRDKGVCAKCGHDSEAARLHWLERRRAETDWLDPWAKGKESAYLWTRKNPRPPKPEYDHIIPFAEGGLTILENMRTLCPPCHRVVTAEFAKRRAEARAAAKRGGKQLGLGL